LTEVDDDDDVDKINVVDKVDGSNYIKDVEEAEGEIDYVYFLTDEVYLLEYYLKQIEEINESDFTVEDYSEGILFL
jgi:hypothetical protein